MKSLKTTITVTSSDKVGSTGELDAIRAYLGNLKPQCEVYGVPNHAERTAERQQERA